MLSDRVKQTNGIAKDSNPEEFQVRLKNLLVSMHNLQQSMKIPEDAKARQPEDHNRMMDAFEELVDCDSSNFLFKDKQKLMNAAMDELDGYGPLGPVMRGEQGYKYPVEMKADGSFWYGNAKLNIQFFDAAHRARTLKRLGKPAQVTSDGFAEFPITIFDEDENERMSTHHQYLRIPHTMLQ